MGSQFMDLSWITTGDIFFPPVVFKTVPFHLFVLLLFLLLKTACGRPGTGQCRGPAHSAGGNRLHPDTATGQGVSACGKCLPWAVVPGRQSVQAGLSLFFSGQTAQRHGIFTGGWLRRSCWLLQPIPARRCMAVAVFHVVYLVSSETPVEELTLKTLPN